MPESRDRLSRPVDVAAVFVRRRQTIGGIAILLDEPEVDPGTPFRWGATPMTAPYAHMEAAATRGGGGGVGRGGSRTPRARVGRGQNLRRGYHRASGSLLPSWYPRTPLRDITAVVRAIERRRSRLGVTEGLEIESPLRQDQDAQGTSSISSSDAQLEHDSSMVTPKPFAVAGKKPFPGSVGKVSKILLDITNQNTTDLDCLTPEKKLMNSIDTVQKMVKEELNKLKRTPAAKKAERNQKVRTLMSMR